MIVKVYNEKRYVVVTSYKEIMRLKLNHINNQTDTKKRIQEKINFFST